MAFSFCISLPIYVFILVKRKFHDILYLIFKRITYSKYLDQIGYNQQYISEAFLYLGSVRPINFKISGSSLAVMYLKSIPKRVQIVQ